LSQQADKNNRDQELALVASMHYLQQMDQKDIATKINSSRSTVSRMLKEAVSRGIVNFTVNHPMSRNAYLEQQLCETLGFREAYVSDAENVVSEEQQRTLGKLGAQCLAGQLPEGGSLAICWGRATRLVVENLAPEPYKHLHVIQMIGSMGTSDSKIDGVELTKLAARNLRGTYELLNAPLVVDDAESASSLMRQSAILRVLKSAENADCALVGLGSIDQESSALVSAGFMSSQDASQAAELGAVGDVSGMLIDADGLQINSTFSTRVIGLSLSSIKRIRTTVAVAYGNQKVQVIHAAAKAGLINVLITDTSTARDLLVMKSIVPAR
jgi:deoxyribonucleoside regulator